MGLTLLVSGWALFAIYLVLFTRAMSSLTPDRRKQFVTEGRPPMWQYGIGALLVLCVVLVPSRLVRIGIAVVFLLSVALAAWAQQRRLKRLGFDRTFRNRLARSTGVVAVAIALFLGSMVSRVG